MRACRLPAERDSERIVYARDSRAIRGLGDAEGLSVPRACSQERCEGWRHGRRGQLGHAGRGRPQAAARPKGFTGQNGR
jgi:hypothetical protein